SPQKRLIVSPERNGKIRHLDVGDFRFDLSTVSLENGGLAAYGEYLRNFAHLEDRVDPGHSVETNHDVLLDEGFEARHSNLHLVSAGGDRRKVEVSNLVRYCCSCTPGTLVDDSDICPRNCRARLVPHAPNQRTIQDLGIAINGKYHHSCQDKQADRTTLSKPFHFRPPPLAMWTRQTATFPWRRNEKIERGKFVSDESSPDRFSPCPTSHSYDKRTLESCN